MGREWEEKCGERRKERRCVEETLSDAVGWEWERRDGERGVGREVL